MKFKALILSLTLTQLAPETYAQQLAFPGAEGYAAYATGGRGKQVVHVTNLNASGTGSLADAVSQSNRFVVFDVGGVIDITNTSITIASNITIAGQTAPGEGITIYGGRVIATQSKNVIIRYIRMRGGKSVNQKKCTLTLDNCENVILDHCTISWGPWDNVHIKDANNITWQNCIIAEGIEPQRFGSITDGTRNWTISHCLWSNNKSRNPKMKCYVQYYNNVVYNYSNGIVGGHSAADNYQDVMNNYFIAGPETSNAATSTKYFDQWTTTDHLYSSGNYYDGNCDGVLNGRLITDHNEATVMKTPNFNTSHPMNLETAKAAYNAIVEHAGASRIRDSHDRRIIDQLKSLGQQGAFIANEDNVNGIGTVAGGVKPKDTDNDGMPDDWEQQNGLNPNANDANAYTLGSGYTNIEHYVNSLAQTSVFLSSPQNLSLEVISPTEVKLNWTNGETTADVIVIEQSEDGKTFHEAMRVDGSTTTATISGLTAEKVYFFRVKAIAGDAESAYSEVVSVNNEYMLPGRGTPAGTATFQPAEGKLYRIINYATVPYNSSSNINGVPKYLVINANGSLGSTEDFLWDDPALLWEITSVEGGFHIRNYGTGTYITPTNGKTGAGDDRIGQTDQPSIFTINYTGDQTPSHSGLSAPVSMYRINSPSNKNQQIRARGFSDDWIWGSGTYDRADMVFTFTEIDATLLPLFTATFEATLKEAEALSATAKPNETLGYPQTAIDTFNDVLASAQAFSNEVKAGSHNQEEVNLWVKTLQQAIATLKATCIYSFTGFSANQPYIIYSYGTMANANTTNAAVNIPRRYLYAIKSHDASRDSLVYRIGLSDQKIAAGESDDIMARRAARWALEAAEDGKVYVRNVECGAYLQIDNYLSATPVTIRPYYAKHDNGKAAFFLDADENGNRLFNVGNPDPNGEGGPLAIFSIHADRTRLRWVIEETTVPEVVIDDIGTIISNERRPNNIYSLTGIPIRTHASSVTGLPAGIYLSGNKKIIIR